MLATIIKKRCDIDKICWNEFRNFRWKA